MKRTVAALLGGFALAPGAVAQEAGSPQFYAWLGYGVASFDEDVAGDTARPGVVQGKLGWRFHDHFAVEAEGGVGVDKDVALPGQLKVKHEYGAFAVASWPVVSTLEVFARAGYVDAEVEANNAPAADQGGSGAAFGAGAVWYVGPLDVRLDYTRYEIENRADGFVVSLGGRF